MPIFPIMHKLIVVKKTIMSFGEAFWILKVKLKRPEWWPRGGGVARGYLSFEQLKSLLKY